MVYIVKRLVQYKKKAVELKIYILYVECRQIIVMAQILYDSIIIQLRDMEKFLSNW